MMQARLRKLNACVAALMLALFLFHGVSNALLLFDVGAPASKLVARATMTLAIVHAVLSTYLSIQTVRASRSAKASYPLLNKRFWTVRISGVAVALFLVCHMLAFLQTGDGAYRLKEFAEFELVTNLGLVVSLALHILTNMRPLMVSLGIPSPRARACDAAFALSLLLLLMGAAFVVYFLRWSVI